MVPVIEVNNLREPESMIGAYANPLGADNVLIVASATR
jgi:hypothetical protein